MKPLLVLVLLASTACAHRQPAYEPGLNTAYLNYLMQQRTNGTPLTPEQQYEARKIGESAPDLVGHTCTSTPIFDAWGRFVRTSVNCW